MKSFNAFFIFLVSILMIQIGFASESIIDGQVFFPTKKINGQFVYRERDEQELKERIRKVGNVVIEEAVSAPSADQVFISTSILMFKNRSDYEKYFTQEGIEGRIKTLLEHKGVLEFLGREDVELDSQLSYLKGMYGRR